MPHAWHLSGCLTKPFPTPASFSRRSRPFQWPMLISDTFCSVWFSGKKRRRSPAVPSGSSGPEEQVRLLPPGSHRGPSRERGGGSGASGAGRGERNGGCGARGTGRAERWERGGGMTGAPSVLAPRTSRPHASPAPAAQPGPPARLRWPQPRRSCSGRAAPGPLWPLCPAGPAHPAAPAPHRRGAAPRTSALRTSAPPSLLPPSSGPSPRTAPHRPRPGPAGRTHLDAQRILPSRASCRASPVGAAAEPGPAGGAGRAGRSGAERTGGGPGADTGGGGAGAVGHGRTRAVPAAPGPAGLEPRDDKGPEQGMFP